MHIVCWISRTTGILGIYNTYCFSMVTMVTSKSLNFAFIRTLLVLYTFDCLSLYFCCTTNLYVPPSHIFGGVSNFTCYCLYQSKARILQVRLKGGSTLARIPDVTSS